MAAQRLYYPPWETAQWTQRGCGVDAERVSTLRLLSFVALCGYFPSCTQASHPSLKSPINSTEATKGFILTTERRLIKISAPSNATANKEDYICRTSEGGDWYYGWWIKTCPANMGRVPVVSGGFRGQSNTIKADCSVNLAVQLPPPLFIPLYAASFKTSGGREAVFYCFLSAVKKQ